MSLFDMFDDSGKKIKEITFYLFWLAIVGDIVLAFEFGKDRWGDFNLLAFCVILVAGAIIVYLESLFLSAFGELVENMAKCNRHAEEMAEDVKKLKEQFDNSIKCDDKHENKGVPATPKTDTDSSAFSDSCTRYDF